ncbi:MAG: DUF981 family protein [Conexivisphaerales archaeon]
MFVDDLALMLFLLSILVALIAYTTMQAFIRYRKGKSISAVKSSLNDTVIPGAIIGILMVAFSLFGEFVWPLPGAYNILFFDLYLLAGIVILSYSFAVFSNRSVQISGFIAMLSGLITILYGLSGYSIGLTKEPSILLLLYLVYGITGIIGYPVTFYLDSMRENNRKISTVVKFVFALFWVLLVVSGVLSAAVGVESVPAHLQSPP